MLSERSLYPFHIQLSETECLLFSSYLLKLTHFFICNQMYLKYKTPCDMVFAKVFLQKGRRAKCINRYVTELWNFTIAIVLNLLCWILMLECYQIIAIRKCSESQMYIDSSMNVNYFIHTKFSVQWNMWLFL